MSEDDTRGDEHVTAAVRVASSGTARHRESIVLAHGAFAADAACWRSKVEEAVRLIDEGDFAGARAALAELFHDG